MPTYEYQCGTCGNRFEKFQSFSDEPIKICPECGNPVKKVFSPAGIIFKGSGWYINDSKKTSSAMPSSSSSSAKSDNGNGSDSKSDSASSSDTKSDSPATGDTKSDTKTESASSKKSEAAA